MDSIFSLSLTRDLLYVCICIKISFLDIVYIFNWQILIFGALKKKRLNVNLSIYTTQNFNAVYMYECRNINV